MFEAVNSVLSNAPFLRGSVEQVTSARDVSAEKSIDTPQVPYISPYIHVDPDTDKAVLQIRDSETGDVLREFPSKGALQVAEIQSLQISEPPQTQERQQSSVVAAQEAPPVPAISTAASAEVAVSALSAAASSGQTQTTFATQA